MAKDTRWVCDCCGAKFAKEEFVVNEITVSMVEEFKQWLNVCTPCAEKVKKFINEL